ncbi:TlpA disulfide reductase family protein [uncultured Bacteroides sp.]|uniref:TlpA disulfide reductase family protein n=1 Tax=uncultured Bacteroides sp. TaxID=162156 RepID=UPI002AAA87E6|nr:TlpA disulfide reductase family protein [uncultured Bacteroides sp.]
MKKKVNTLGLVVLTMILASFSLKDGFIVKGHIDGIEDGTWVKLYDLDQGMYIDSAVSKGGNFILKGSVDYPRECWIKCKDEYSIIQMENTEFTFNSPLKEMHQNSKIKGGKEQELQNELSKIQQPNKIIYYSALDSLLNNLYTNEDQKSRLIKTLDETNTIIQNNYISYAKNHPNSYLGVDILYSNRMSIPKDTLKSIYKNLPPELQETRRGKSLKIHLYEELAEKGKPFIDFTVKDIKGNDFSLSSLKGQYIYLSFWSAGCGPCRMENKLLSKSSKELPKGLALVSFSIDKSRKYWDIATEADSITWHNVSDLSGVNGKIKTQYQVQAIPTSFLIDKDGIIIEKFIGYDTEMLERLNKLVDEHEGKKL